MAKNKPKRSAAQKRATAKMVAARKASLGKKKATKARVTRRSPVAKKKTGKGRKRTAAWRKRPAAKRKYALRRKRVHRINPPGRRRRYRRNPGIASAFSPKAIMGGVMDGLFVTGGEVGARTVNGFIPLGDGLVMTPVKAVLSAAAIDIVGGMVVKGDRHRMLRAGAYSYAAKLLVSTFIPQVRPMLGMSGYDDQIGSGEISGYVSDVTGVGEMYEGTVGEYVSAYE